MKNKELTPQDEAMNEWLNNNKGCLITSMILIISVIAISIYLISCDDECYKGGCDKSKTENTKIK